MTVNFYNYSAENNRVDKTSRLTATVTLTGTPFPENNISTPSITVESQTPINGNYAYISDYGRYYFVTRVTWIGDHCWRVDLRCDTLMSFKTAIQNTVAFVARNENDGKPYITDNSYVYESDPIEQIIDSTEGELYTSATLNAIMTYTELEPRAAPDLTVTVPYGFGAQYVKWDWNYAGDIGGKQEYFDGTNPIVFHVPRNTPVNIEVHGTVDYAITAPTSGVNKIQFTGDENYAVEYEQKDQPISNITVTIRNVTGAIRAEYQWEYRGLRGYDTKNFVSGEDITFYIPAGANASYRITAVGTVTFTSPVRASGPSLTYASVENFTINYTVT